MENCISLEIVSASKVECSQNKEFMFLVVQKDQREVVLFHILSSLFCKNSLANLKYISLTKDFIS